MGLISLRHRAPNALSWVGQSRKYPLRFNATHIDDVENAERDRNAAGGRCVEAADQETRHDGMGNYFWCYAALLVDLILR
jgi:hypothetical protein